MRAGREVLAVDAVVDVVVAINDANLHVPVGDVLDGAGRVAQHRVHLVVAHVLAVLGEVAGDEDGVGLVDPHVLERLGEDVGALAEHLAVGVLGLDEVLALAEELVRHVVDV